MSHLQAVEAPEARRYEYGVAYAGVGRGWYVMERELGSLSWVMAARPFTSRESALEHAVALERQDSEQR